MSEVMTNQATMYDSVEAIRNLNSVEGFNPRDFMRVIQGKAKAPSIIWMWRSASSGSV